MKRQLLPPLHLVLILTVALLLGLSPGGAAALISSRLALAPASRAVVADDLTFIETHYDGLGLDGASSLALSPDGVHLYVTGSGDNTVLVFRRAGTSGRLTWVQTQRDGVGGVDGLEGASGLAVSPDGSHVYVASSGDDAVAVFGRDASSGALTFVEREREPHLHGLSGANAVAVSPDGGHVYVTSGEDDSVMVFSRDAASGGLTFVEQQLYYYGTNGANGVAVSPDGSHVYVTGGGADAVTVFSRDVSSGALTVVEAQRDGVGGVDGLDGARSVAVSPDGSHVYVVGRWDDALAVFARDASSGALTFVELNQDGVGGVDGLDWVRSVALSPDGGHIYATGEMDDAVAVFSRDASSGALTFVELRQDGVGGVDGLDGAAAVAVSPDGGHVYVAGQGDDAVAAFGRDASTGGLTFVEVQRDDAGAVDGLDGASAVALSPDGSHVYVTGGTDHAVAAFRRDEGAGALSYVGVVRDGVDGVDGLSVARAVALSSDGKHVYVAGAGDDAVTVFRRDVTSGALTFVELHQDGVGGVDGLDGAYSVAVSPNGSHVYVAGRRDDAVAVFSRDASSGTLSFVEAQRDGVGGVDGLNGADAVAVSPDGEHVYVAGWDDDALSVFSRDAATGALTIIEWHRDDAAGVWYLEHPSSVALSPDGSNVYVTAEWDWAVAVFSRDATSGALTIVEFAVDGVGGVHGLEGPSAVAVSPDGSRVYVTGQGDDALAVFDRDAVTGGLAFVGTKTDDWDGVHGLGSPSGVAVSPDDKHVYVTSESEDAVAVFGVSRSINVHVPLLLKD